VLGPEGAGLRYEHLDLTIVKVETQDTILDGSAVSRIEDVAHNFALTEASIGDVSMNLTVDIVGETDKELSTSERINLVIDPLLSEGGVNNTLGLSRLVEGLCEFEEICRPIEVSPHDLSVIGVVATCETLLTAVVEEGDASRGKSKSKGALEESLVRLCVQET